MPALRTKDKYECQHCGKQFGRPYDLKRHVQVHDPDARKCNCPEPGCDFSTLQKSNLDTHIRTHSGTKSKVCPDCDFATCDPSSLTRHRKHFHGYSPNRANHRRRKPVLDNTTASLPTSRRTPPDSSHPGSIDSVSMDSLLTFPEELPTCSMNMPEIHNYHLVDPPSYPHFESANCLSTRHACPSPSDWTFTSSNNYHAPTNDAYPKIMYPGSETGLESTSQNREIGSSTFGDSDALRVPVPSSSIPELEECFDVFQHPVPTVYEEWTHFPLDHDYLSGGSGVEPHISSTFGSELCFPPFAGSDSFNAMQYYPIPGMALSSDVGTTNWTAHGNEPFVPAVSSALSTSSLSSSDVGAMNWMAHRNEPFIPATPSVLSSSSLSRSDVGTMNWTAQRNEPYIPVMSSVLSSSSLSRSQAPTSFIDNPFLISVSA
ncbi:hypothetical protein K435DRAFT_967270 [Dendrothele bispora CBS 962.96]|uniref:C2H2-type domain-containing protein n=1 Tax=Dendrothele bispora (strain CBS 962.96) TaxID=1314807 RepID=A0A4V4HF50_DENBC|nr:hypothetical protein K435DRAFT_967270 [Dendrothele bispora CBS 962.96]